MALGYLLGAAFQNEDKNGKPRTGGTIRVCKHGTTTPYITYRDFDGNRNPADVPLNDEGMAVIIADDANAYDVYFKDALGVERWSRLNVTVGGVSLSTITSTDGSIIVTQTAAGVDLRVDSEAPSTMRCTATSLLSDDVFDFSELQRDGQNAFVNNGEVVVNEGWWHYDITARLRWPANPAENVESEISLYCVNGSDSISFDRSYRHDETLQLSGEFKSTQDGTAFNVGVNGIPSGMTVDLVDFGIHSIVGEGAGGKYNAGTGIDIDEPNRIISVDFDEVQEKLTAGTGITIDNEGVISVDESAVQGIFPVTYDSTTFQEIRTALIAGQLPVMFRNDGADFALQVQRIPLHSFFYVGGSPGSSYAQFWSPYVYTSSSPSLPPYALFAVYSASYDFETHNTTWSTSYKYISEQSDWAESDATKLTFIKNKPDLSVYATQTELTNGLATKQDVISDLATIRAGAAAGATAVQDADYVHTDENFTTADKTKLSSIASGAEVNVQANWTEADSSSDAYIQNKPAIPSGSQLVPSATPSDAGEVLTVDQQGVPAWAPAQAPISAGNGVDITNNVVSTKVDGTTIGFNASGELETLVGNDSAYLAHYGTTTYAEISAAVAAGKAVFVTDVSGAITAVMPMTSFNTNPAMVIFTLLIGSIEYKATLSSGTWSATTVDIQADWNEAFPTNPAYINNKPTIPSGTQLVPSATSADANKVLTVNFFGVPNWAAVPSQVQSDWTEADNTDPSYIQNKPSLATVATSGLYSDLSGKPTINNVPAVTSSDDNKVLKASYTGGVGSYSWEQESGGTVTDVEVDGVSVVSGGVASITTPTVDQTYNSASTNAQSGVAVAGAIANVNQVPASTSADEGKILKVDANGDPEWATGGGGGDAVLTYNVSTWSDFITAYNAGKNIRAVETYNGVTYEYTLHEYNPNGTPSAYAIFTTTKANPSSSSVQNRWCQIRASDSWSSGSASIQGNLSGQGAISVNPDTRRISLKLDGSSLTQSNSGLAVANPLPSTLGTAGQVLTVNAGSTGVEWATPSGGGSVTDVEVDGVSVVSGGVASITMPTVDQVYDGTSANAQSGTAVAGAIATKEDAFDVGTGLEMDTSGATPTLQVEAPVDIVAGPGIVIDNPDGNTLRVSVATDYEVELYKHTTVAYTKVNDVYTMSEPITNFERIRIEFWNREFQFMRISFEYYVTDAVANSTQFVAELDASTGTNNIQRVNMAVGFNASGNLVDKMHGLFYGNGGNYTNGNERGLGIHRVVGIHRINGGN